MTPILLSTFTAHAARARSWRSGQDPAPLRDALALAAALAATGAIDRVPLATRRDLATVARRFLSKAPSGEDAPIAHAIARAGLDALTGATTTSAASPPRSHPSALELVRMTRGEPDPLGAGATALHVRRCDRCQGEIAMVHATALGEAASSAAAAEPILLAAAAEPSAMRDPAEGRRVAALGSPEVEAVLFESGGTRRLAIYGDRHTTLRLVAPGVVTEDALGGYWLGRIDGDVLTLDATLHAGGDTIPWRIDLDDD